MRRKKRERELVVRVIEFIVAGRCVKTHRSKIDLSAAVADCGPDADGTIGRLRSGGPKVITRRLGHSIRVRVTYTHTMKFPMGGEPFTVSIHPELLRGGQVIL